MGQKAKVKSWVWKLEVELMCHESQDVALLEHHCRVSKSDALGRASWVGEWGRAKGTLRNQQKRHSQKVKERSQGTSSWAARRLDRTRGGGSVRELVVTKVSIKSNGKERDLRGESASLGIQIRVQDGHRSGKVLALEWAWWQALVNFRISGVDGFLCWLSHIILQSTVILVEGE